MIILVSIGEILPWQNSRIFCEITYWNYEKLPFHLTKYTSLPYKHWICSIIEFFMEYLMEPHFKQSTTTAKTHYRF